MGIFGLGEKWLSYGGWMNTKADNRVCGYGSHHA